MPVNIPDKLPAAEVLRNENIFIMDQSRATTQDIRPLRIAILNLMPLKETTETHLIRMLSNSPLQVEITLLYTISYCPKNTSFEHLDSFYKSYEDVKHKKYDGLIITGAPIEHLEFEEVHYWKELTNIFEWANTNVTSTLFICWGAQAALYYYYGIKKYNLPKKLFGIFSHTLTNNKNQLVRGFDDFFLAPHSRNTYTKIEDLEQNPEIEVISISEEAGLYIAASKNKKQVFVTGHSEYDPETLNDEYVRDLQKGLPIEQPLNYFPNDDPSRKPLNRWKSHGNLLFSNWLNYYVYQETPFDI